MATSKKEFQPKIRRASRKRGQKSRRGIDPRAPWKASWYVLWGFISVVGELILIFLVRGKVVSPSTLQEVVIFICIPIVAHLLVSAFRTILISISY